MYVVLLSAIAMGLITKLTHSTISHGYDYRVTIAPWARSLFTLHPKVALMEHIPLTYQIHAVIGLLLFALLPFILLVHMFSAPVEYLFRPYIIYRSRDPQQLAERPARRGWERIGS
jgi:nitrate reductase gamma subunit